MHWHYYTSECIHKIRSKSFLIVGHKCHSRVLSGAVWNWNCWAVEFETCNLSLLIFGGLFLNSLGPNYEISNFHSFLVMSKDSTLGCFSLGPASYLQCKLWVEEGN